MILKKLEEYGVILLIVIMSIGGLLLILMIQPWFWLAVIAITLARLVI